MQGMDIFRGIHFSNSLNLKCVVIVQSEHLTQGKPSHKPVNDILTESKWKERIDTLGQSDSFSP